MTARTYVYLESPQLSIRAREPDPTDVSARPRQRTRFLDLLAALLFGFGLILTGFTYGVAVGYYRVFPLEVLKSGVDAAQAITTQLWPPSTPWMFEVEHERTGVSVYDPARAYQGYTFLAGVFDNQPRGVLIDMSGTVLHEWQINFSKVWPDARHIIYQAPDHMIDWHGAHLFPNGDVLFNFESGNFPLGGGLVKLDRHSNVIWALPHNTHHDVEVLDDGTIIAASQTYRETAVPEGGRLRPPYMEDTILTVASDGNVIDEISVLGALTRSAHAGLLSTDRLVWDPLHLNDIEVLDDEMAAQFPMFKAGDILVSLRNLNAIAVIDPERGEVTWSMSGLFVRQHDPDFLPNGNILLFDNRGGVPLGGGSRILEIDPKTQEIVWRYEGSEDRPFYTRIRGKQEPLPNGNVLVVESEGGRIFEVTGDPSPSIVWEYVNRASSGDKVGMISSAQRVAPNSLEFLADEGQSRVSETSRAENHARAGRGGGRPAKSSIASLDERALPKHPPASYGVYAVIGDDYVRLPKATLSRSENGNGARHVIRSLPDKTVEPGVESFLVYTPHRLQRDRVPIIRVGRLAAIERFGTLESPARPTWLLTGKGAYWEIDPVAGREGMYRIFSKDGLRLIPGDWLLSIDGANHLVRVEGAVEPTPGAMACVMEHIDISGRTIQPCDHQARTLWRRLM